MRLERYLNEKYLNAVKHSGKTFEVFTNPSKDELRELGDIRGIIDTKTKTLYVWSAYMNHYNMMKENPTIKKALGANADFYWSRGQGIDHIFTFDAPSNFSYINSDTMDFISFELSNPKVLEDLNKLYDADWSFMRKWVRPTEITNVIRDAINQMEVKVG